MFRCMRRVQESCLFVLLRLSPGNASNHFDLSPPNGCQGFIAHETRVLPIAWMR
jgi:hypothetical protein